MTLGSGLAPSVSTLPRESVGNRKSRSKVGRHRRIRHWDLLTYMERIDEESRQALDELSREAQALGMGYWHQLPSCYDACVFYPAPT